MIIFPNKNDSYVCKLILLIFLENIMTRHVLIETNDSEDDIIGSDYQSDAMICMPGYPCNTSSTPPPRMYLTSRRKKVLDFKHSLASDMVRE